MKHNILSIILLCAFLITSCNGDKILVTGDTTIKDISIAFKTNADTDNFRTKLVDNINIGDSCTVSVDVEPLPYKIPQTRASLIDNNNLTTMGVTGYYTKGGEFDASSSMANYLVNERVFNNGTEWVYTNIKYWPSDPSDRISFFVYAPYFMARADDGAQSTVLNFAKKGIPTISYTSFADKDLQYDLMVGVPLMNNSKPAINTPLNFTMKHVLSSIGFTVTGNGEKFDNIYIQGIYCTGTLSMDISNGITWYDYLDISDKNTAPKAGIGRTITSSTTIEQVNTQDGYIMLVPQDVPDGAELVIELGDVEIKRVKLKQILAKWEPGKRYIYNLNFKNPDEIEVDLTGDESNCFLLNPVADKNVTYKLPIKQVNRFWGNATYNSPTPSNLITSTDTWQVGLLWQDKLNMVKPSGETSITISKSTGGGIDDYFAIRIPKGASIKAGNFLVGISKNGTPSLTEISPGITNILWSWHIWISDYNPYGAQQNPIDSGTGKETAVPGGKLYTYADGTMGTGDKTLWSSKKYNYILDRNIGALIPNHTSRTYKDGMLTYQFGRKDPFPGDITLYDINGNTINYVDANNYTINSSSSPKPTLEWSVYNPLKFANMIDYAYYPDTKSDNSGRWCYNFDGSTGAWNDPSVTDAYGKSLFDPSPQKFRMPINGTWSAAILGGESGRYSPNNGYIAAPYIYPICYARNPSNGKIGTSTDGEVAIWSSTPLPMNGSNSPGRGSAFWLYLSYDEPQTSYTGNPAKATARAVRSVQ